MKKTVEKRKINGLTQYCDTLPGVAYRKLYRKIKHETLQTSVTVTLWLRKGSLPRAERDRQIIADIIGKSREELFTSVNHE
ncbi:MAG: hypothetical protein SNJ71_00250 [Bacteroidales bacterium]